MCIYSLCTVCIIRSFDETSLSMYWLVGLYTIRQQRKIKDTHFAKHIICSLYTRHRHSHSYDKLAIYIRYSAAKSDSLSNDSNDLCYCVSADHLSNDSIRCIVRFGSSLLYFFYVSRLFSGFLHCKWLCV